MLIEGADANASVTGNESTVPMQLRITGLVEMPNSKTYDATGCFVGLEAWGDVSSERAIVRTRNISCLKDGKTIDMPIIRDSEIQNFCLHGTVGAGKSEVIRRLANYARKRGDMVVIYDRSMGENRNRRVWFFCDELPTLHKLPDLVEILPEARKFGGCYVFGIQSYAQLEDIYGEKAAATLFDVMNTRAFFRSPSHKIAEFAAGEIGEKEHLKASEQYSYGADPVRDGVSTGKDMERQTLVSYSDIQSLPDLTCYVTLPGPYPAVKLSLKYQTRPKVAPEFIPRDINPEMENRLSAVLAAREAEGRQMASLFEPDVPEVVSGEDVTQAEQPQQPQQPVSPAINDKKSDSGVNVPAGGIEQELKMKPEEEMEQQLPPGISESGEVVDMAAYEAWQQENHPDTQQQMQRREEVNINVHRERGEDVEPGDDF